MTSIRLAPEIEKRLSKLAETTGRTKSYYLRKAIEEKLEEMEDTYIAVHRLENPTTTKTLDEIADELDISV